jgi:hypothetical protein
VTWRVATLTALLLLSVRPAVASPADAERLENLLDLGHPPPCSVCHGVADAAPPELTLFGRALARAGFVESDPETMAKAVESMRKADVDSDGDGATDIDELEWGGDPNTPDLPTERPVTPPSYGCSVDTKHGVRFEGVPALLTFVILAARRRRRASQLVH